MTQQEMAEHIKKLARENSELRANAMRYLWLRNTARSVVWAWKISKRSHSATYRLSPEYMDRSIDEAISKMTKEQ